MYKLRSFDIKILDQRWFVDLPDKYKSLFMYFFMKQSNIGIWEVNLTKFCQEWYASTRGPDEFDIYEFTDACNSDGVERADLIDEGRVFWMKTGLRFLNGKKDGTIHLTKGDGHPPLIRELAQWPETRDWFLQQLLGNQGKITVGRGLIDWMILRGIDEPLRPFVQDIAKAAGFDIDVNRLSDFDLMKEQYDCICQYCGGVFKPVEMEIDHIIPKSKGGKNYRYNMIPACMSCNKQKGDRSVFEFMKSGGFKWTDGLTEKVEKLVRKGFLNSPSDSPIKEKTSKKKVQYFTYDQVRTQCAEQGLVMDKDFEKTDEGWRRK